MDKNANNSKPNWAQISTLIISFFTTLIITIIGYNLQNVIKDKEVNQKYVELAISILREKPIENESTIMRHWALDVLNTYSRVKFSDSAKQELIFNPLKARLDNLPKGVICKDGWTWAIDYNHCPECDSLNRKK